MNKKPKYLFHGSSTFIKGEIFPRKANDNSNPGNNLEGIYATSELGIAKAMSLTDDNVKHSSMDYSKKSYLLICIKGEPNEKINHYIYILSSSSFEKTNNSFWCNQWISREPVKIERTIILPKSEIKKYWRRATKEEIEKVK